MDNKFKVIDENNNELEAEIITVFDYKEKEYVIYAINKEEENADICVSLLEKDSNNYPIFKDINDSKEKEEIDKNEDFAYFTPKHNDGFRIVNVPLKVNILDTSVLVHEFIHLQNVDTLDPSFEQLYLTEAVSRTYELLFYKFLKDNYILREENNIIVKRFLKRYLRRAHQIKTLTDVIKIYDETKPDIMSLKDDYEEAREMYVKLSKSLKYFIGESIAIYTYQNILRGIVTPKNVEEMSDNLGKHHDFTSLNFILPKVPNKDEFGESLETLKDEIQDKTMKL